MSIYKDFYEENYEKVQKIKEIEKENEQLKKQNEILLGQLVINDGEDVTVQISQSQFDEYNELKEENEGLKEKIIKLTEENGNLIINRNTAENKLQDTESRLISIQKANTHNLVLLQRRNNALEEIREKIKSLKKGICDNCGWYNTDNCQPNGYVCHDLIEILNKINEVLK